ncbi:unnamed protein product [Dovyalis caffra]|uniref:N-acetyltransferase domain-containing protein n=1 Tax=Dovyalis caffra TaxID=77055 RepID=A0AAV1RY45_9ROSI|nr:unnamed protein product [Dovyalis caffra]
MANLRPCCFQVSNWLCIEPWYAGKADRFYHGTWKTARNRKEVSQQIKRPVGWNRSCVMHCCRTSSTSPSSSSSATKRVFLEDRRSWEEKEEQLEYLVSEFGWKVRRLAENRDEMREVAQIQAEAFHIPMALFDDLFFEFFKAEVLSGLLYKLKNSPPDRYACLVAEPAADPSKSERKLVGIVDVTAVRDKDVLQHLEGADEYLYISGIAVSKIFRRQKIGSALLKACDVLSHQWGFEYLALRAYEDDVGARKLYTNAGYRVVSSDPQWVTWIGRKRRVLMIKKPDLLT